MNQWILIGVIFFAAITLHFVNDARQEERTENHQTQEWCEVGQVMSDGSIVYSGERGETNLIAVATSDGPKLFGKCK